MTKKLMKQFIKILGILLVLSGCANESKIKTIKLGHGLDVNHPVHKAMVYMGERLSEKSGGQMSITIYPSQQLGNERQLLELLQIGSLGMTKVSVGVMENFAPKMKVLGLPFIFRDKQHTFDVWDGEVGKMLLQDGAKYWLKGLTFYDAGSRSFYTKERPINQPSDLEGLKIRVMESVTAMDMVKSLGGSPTPISWGELYTALQQGVVDGAENNPPTFYFSRHYEVCKYYSLDEHTALPDVLIIGTHLWDRLNEQEQQWVQEAADESAIYQRELWAQSVQESLNAVQEAGVEIVRPDKSLFAEKVQGLLDSYRSDEQLFQLIQAVQNVK